MVLDSRLQFCTVIQIMSQWAGTVHFVRNGLEVQLLSCFCGGRC